jgi:predicted  nucleic acid-binding Zn-ribbon protein
MLPPETQKRIEGVTSAISAFTSAMGKADTKTSAHIAKEKELNKVTKEKEELAGKIAKNTSIKTTAEESVKAIGKEIAQMTARIKTLGTEEQALAKVEAARRAVQAAIDSGESRGAAMLSSGLGDAQRELEEIRSLTVSI